MPVFVTDFTWTQTDGTVRVHVPLKGARAGKVDVISTDEYLKVSFPPFLFEAFLFEPVDDDRSVVKIGDGAAVFTLLKRTEKTWEHLMVSSDKQRKQHLRQEALLKHQNKLSSRSTSRSEKQRSEKTFLLETVMKLERDQADSIGAMKEAERQRTTAELEAWQRSRQHTSGEDEKCRNAAKNVTKETASGRNIPPGNDTTSRRRKQEALPAPRNSGNIQVTFTPRVFPTALRESRVQEEEEWLQNQAEARRGLSSEDPDLEGLSEEQRNPDWLKDRGDRCFASGDYQSAVNLYSLALRLNRKMAPVFSNRAAAHLKLRNLHKAVQDSTRALDLLTPAVPANSASRARAHVRRGTALCQLQLYAQGLPDYEAALQICPDCADLQSDVRTIRDVIEGRKEISV